MEPLTSSKKRLGTSWYSFSNFGHVNVNDCARTTCKPMPNSLSNLSNQSMLEDQAWSHQPKPPESLEVAEVPRPRARSRCAEQRWDTWGHEGERPRLEATRWPTSVAEPHPKDTATSIWFRHVSIICLLYILPRTQVDHV